MSTCLNILFIVKEKKIIGVAGHHNVIHIEGQHKKEKNAYVKRVRFL